MDMIDIFIFLAESILLGLMTFMAVCRVKQVTFDWKSDWKNKRFVAVSVILFVIHCLLYFLRGTDTVVFQFLTLIAAYLLFSVVDLKTKNVPNEMLLCMGAEQLLYVFRNSDLQQFLWSLAAGVVVYVVCMLLTVISKEGFGLGDAKLLGMTAIFTGGAYVLQIAFWGLICAFICSIFILAYHKGNRKTELPFVPFLTLGIFLHIVVWRLL